MAEVEDKANMRHIGADHQLSPPVPWYRKRWILWTGVLTLLLLAAILFLVIHEKNAKADAAKRALAAAKPSVTATVATAAKGSIGIYLRCHWHGNSGLHLLHHRAGKRCADGSALQRGTIRSEGRCADRH
jgi:hypothetical protein